LKIGQSKTRILYERDSLQQKSFDNDLIDYICLDGAPLSVGERIGFKKLIQKLDSKLRIPSRRKIGRKLHTEAKKVHRTNYVRKQACLLLALH